MNTKEKADALVKKNKIAGVLFASLLLASCQNPAIIVKQRAVCVYNDHRRAEFDYRRTEHLNPIVTSYSARPGKYEVGRVYIIKIVSK